MRFLGVRGSHTLAWAGAFWEGGSHTLADGVAVVGQAVAAYILLLACQSDGLGWPGLQEHPSWSHKRYAASEAHLTHYLFLGSALHGVSSGLLQSGIMALAYDIPIPLGETELFNPDARTAGILTGTARGWMVGPLLGGIAAVVGGPFLALLLAAVGLSGLAVMVALYFPTTTRRMAVPDVMHLAGDPSVRWLLPGVGILGLTMAILRPIFPIHCNIKAQKGDEFAVGLSFSIFFSALHASGPVAEWIRTGRERPEVVVVGLVMTGIVFPLLLAHSQHLAETGGMALAGLSVGVAVQPAIPWLTEASQRQGGRAPLREARLAFDRCFGLGAVLGPALGGFTVSEHGGIIEPVLLTSLLLIGYAGYGAKLIQEQRMGEDSDPGGVGGNFSGGRGGIEKRRVRRGRG